MRPILWDCSALRVHLAVAEVRQTVIARLLGVTQPTFNRMCTGISIPTLDEQKVIADHLGVSIEELFDELQPEKLRAYQAQGLVRKG